MLYGYEDIDLSSVRVKGSGQVKGNWLVSGGELIGWFADVLYQLCEECGMVFDEDKSRDVLTIAYLIVNNFENVNEITSFIVRPHKQGRADCMIDTIEGTIDEICSTDGRNQYNDCLTHLSRNVEYFLEEFSYDAFLRNATDRKYNDDRNWHVLDRLLVDFEELEDEIEDPRRIVKQAVRESGKIIEYPEDIDLKPNSSFVAVDDEIYETDNEVLKDIDYAISDLYELDEPDEVYIFLDESDEPSLNPDDFDTFEEFKTALFDSFCDLVD